MSQSIPVVGAGDEISVVPLNRIAEEVQSRTLMRVAGMHVQQRSTGTLVGRRPGGLQPGPRRGQAIYAHPFQVMDASTTSPAAAKVRVRFGQVNSVTPTIGGVALDNATAPLLTVSSGIIYLAVVVDVDGIVTSVTVNNGSSLPAADETHGYITLATVTVVSDAITAINQSVTHSLGHQKCGTDIHNFWGV